MIVIMFTKTRHWSLSCARCIHSKVTHCISLRHNFILPSTPKFRDSVKHFVTSCSF